jgi:hypothetical protein
LGSRAPEELECRKAQSSNWTALYGTRWTCLRIAIGSSTKKDELEKYLDIARIADLVDVKTSSEDAEESKPAPDVDGLGRAERAHVRRAEELCSEVEKIKSENAACDMKVRRRRPRCSACGRRQRLA